LIASGIGLATAKALSQRPGWDIHILDLNAAQGQQAAAEVGGSRFHAVDITDYDALAAVFKAIFMEQKRLDFVYANAGIGEHNNSFYQVSQGSDSLDPPPPPAHQIKVVDVCMTAAVTTAWLAQHYFRLSPASSRGERSLVFTASCGALYASYGSPAYTAAKHGVLGFMRATAPFLWRNDGVRANAVLPGTVRTGLLSEAAWTQFPAEYFTPVDKIVEAVLILVDGVDKEKGVGGPGRERMVGKAIECSGLNRYYRDQYEYCDEAMRVVMGSTDTEK
jgi:NAD(P)-dependent dehydrogenase (short-subunit alcohol dehydrogenase family)